MVDSGGANRHWNSRRFKMCTTHHSVGSVNVCCELDCFLLSFLFPLLLRMLLEIPIFLFILIYQLLIQNHCVDYQRSYNKRWNVLIERINCNFCTNILLKMSLFNFCKMKLDITSKLCWGLMKNLLNFLV